MTCFRDQVNGLCGKRVRLGRGGPDERKGTLVGLGEDFMTVYCDDGSLVHYPMHHLKSLTELINETSSAQQNADLPEEFDDLPVTFNGLMNAFKGRKVQVYDHGPESATGFIFDVGDDYVKIVTSPDEIVHYPYFHIRSIRLWTPKSNEQQKDNSNKEQQSKDDRSRSESSRSSRDRSRESSSRDRSRDYSSRDRHRDYSGRDRREESGRERREESGRERRQESDTPVVWPDHTPVAAQTTEVATGRIPTQSLTSNQTSLFFSRKSQRAGSRNRMRRS